MPRIVRIESPGSLFHIMAHSFEGKDLFVDDQDRIEFLSRFAKGLTNTGFQCYAWALMDNHYHLLVRSSELPLSKLMRSLNGGYARYYNKKHKKHGYLFQDRFKSVLCQEQDYAKELIRYIHLNPLRAGKVNSLDQLKTFAWCGHGFVLGVENANGEKFQNRQYSLCHFGANESDAIEGYLQYLAKGCIDEDIGKSGKLSAIEAAEIESSFKGKLAVIGDKEFVKAAMEKYKENLSRKHRKADYPLVLDTISNKVCTEFGIAKNELLRRGRKNKRSDARAAFCYQSHRVELIPLSVIAKYLHTTIPPIAVLVNKQLCKIMNS
jgi:REP element-mobilizing transposase RayT